MISFDEIRLSPDGVLAVFDSVHSAEGFFSLHCTAAVSRSASSSQFSRYVSFYCRPLVKARSQPPIY